MVFLIIIAFVFGSQVQELKLKQYLLNCPYPIFNGVAENVTFSSDQTRLLYDIDYNAGLNSTGNFFECYIDTAASPDAPSVSINAKSYGATAFNVIPYGWYAWVGDTITVFFSKASPLIDMLFLILNAPSQVTNISWFSYINVILVLFIILGVILIARG